MKEERKPCLHAHVKWFYGQSERAYYLNYFIKFFRYQHMPRNPLYLVLNSQRYIDIPVLPGIEA